MDLICFSHLRWNFVYQRPQHLLTRFASKYRVIIIEEPIMDAEIAFLNISSAKENIWIVVPHLAPGINEDEKIMQQQNLLKTWVQNFGIIKYIGWFYTPMALPLLEALPFADLIVYDCMDELSAFKGAAATIKEKESRLLSKADLVFTGGHSLYEAKRKFHSDIYPFPSSIDKNHFMKARTAMSSPKDQINVAHPRIGFFGVIDERFDIDLIDNLALLRPQWQFIFVGPVVKIDPDSLPSGENIHYTGSRPYEELPSYLSGWDVALIPFALNESTQFISPTKTPEYLAGGIPVVSSSISDVVNPYGKLGLVYIADSTWEFIEGIEWGLNMRHNASWLEKVDAFLTNVSWDVTWEQMSNLISNKIAAKQNGKITKNRNEYV